MAAAARSAKRVVLRVRVAVEFVRFVIGGLIIGAQISDC